MTRVHHVKKARKANKNAGIKKGDEYWWWKNSIRSPKMFSRTPPKRSRVTSSTFLSMVYSAQEALEEGKPATFEDLKTLIDEIVPNIEEAKDQAQEAFDNMPEGLQQGDTGQLLEERVGQCEEWIQELEGLDTDGPADGATDEEVAAQLEATYDEAISSCPF